jgi:hypothetical protein
MFIVNLIRKARDLVVRNFHNLMQIHDTPHSISGGVAIGIFFGFNPVFIPFVPIKSTLSFLVSWAFRYSRTAALIAVNAHDVIFPIWPLVLRLEYDLGFLLLHHRLPASIHHHLHHHLGFEHWFSVENFQSWTQWVQERMNWTFLVKVLGPLLLGSVIVGIPFAFLSYAITLRVVNRYQAARSKKSQNSAPVA